MKKVYLGNKELTALGVGGGGDDTKKWVDYFNGTLTEFTVPEGVKSIGDYKFSGCKSLKTITLPDTITSIGLYAFRSCSSLTGITIPNSVTNIGDRAFIDCSSLTGITIPSGVTNIKYYTFQNCSSLTGVTIPSGVTSIGSGAFYNCSSLTAITIPSGVTSIGERAFSACEKLSTMTVKATTPPRLGSGAIPSAIQTIYVPSASVDAYKAASGWSDYADKIQAIPVPAMKVTYTDGSEKTFYNLTSIEENTVSNKTDVKDVEIYDSVTTIGKQAFNWCTSLTSVTIPNSVTSIGIRAFKFCTNLTGVTIPNTVTNIDQEAFGECSSLISVIVKAVTPPTLGWYPIQLTTNLTIYVPSASVDTYKAANGWKNYADKIQAIPS